MQKREGKAIVWLRNDLRATDHAGLYHATQKHQHVYAYYAFDPQQWQTTPWGFTKTGAHRTQFLLETIAQLQHDLAQLNISLIIEQKAPQEGIAAWVAQLGITHLYFQEEWTQEEQQVETELRENLGNVITYQSHYDQFLYHPNDVPVAPEDIPEVFTIFRKKCEKMAKVRPCFAAPKKLDPTNLLDQKFSIPTLQDFGLAPLTQHPHSAFPFKGGHRAGRDRMEHYFWDTKKLSFYKQTRNGLLGIDYSAKLSTWLANGSLSAREIYWEVKEYEAQVEKNQSTYWLIFELIWRDYFKYISLKHGNKIFQQGGILQRDYSWKNSHKLLNKWIEGQTHEPFVNANMIELKKTGWMSNRGRQNVASYFAKNLLMDWRMGAAYFESQLVDYDVHSNYGNWLYVSGVGNDPRDRKFNVRLQAERYDEGGKYQRLWNQNTLFE